MEKKYHLNKILLIIFLFAFTALAFSNTGGNSTSGLKGAASGFGNIVSYIDSVFTTIRYIVTIIALVYFIVKLVECISNGNYGQILQNLFILALVLGLVIGSETLINALSGTTIDVEMINPITIKGVVI